LRGGRQGEQRSFSDIGRAFGAHAEFVREPDQLTAAIERCLAAVDGGIAAVLHVQITPL
jgi:acetolactate synthase-1/2/3 large subunit